MAASLSIALLVLRVVAGLTLMAHGTQKLFAWFGGPGPVKLSEGLKKQGLKPAWLWVSFVILGEVGGGLSLALGFLTPVGAAGGFGAMFMAIFKSHWKNGFWNSKRGLEFPLQLLAIAVAVGIAGPGDYSLDALLRLNLPEMVLFLALAGAAVLVDLVGLGISRTPTPVPQQAVPAQTPGGVANP